MTATTATGARLQVAERMPLVELAGTRGNSADRLSKPRGSGDTARHGSSRTAKSVLVPEFRGATVSEAKRLAAEYTVDVELNGVGLAVTQDPAPGTILTGSRRVVRVRFSAATGEG
jgi:hypothetical protein